MRMTMRVVAAAALIGVGSQAFMAQAGWRHFRMYGSNCCGSACSAPMYVAAPPATYSCGGPACSAPMWGCSGPSGPYPTPYQAGYAPGGYGQSGYGGLPMTAYGAGYGQSTYGSYYDFSAPASNAAGGFGGTGAGGALYGTPISYPQSSPFGGPGYVAPGYGGPAYEGTGYSSGMPSYYAPVPSQYTPVPPAPSSDLVW